MTIKWGLSVSDWHDHAVDNHQDYPGGALQARCGHLLMVVTPLRDTSCGTQCQACATATAASPPPPP